MPQKRPQCVADIDFEPAEQVAGEISMEMHYATIMEALAEQRAFWADRRAR